MTPSTTTSGMPPVAVPTTAAPHAMASRFTDAERLVHARAHERGGRRQDRAELVALQELVDPHDAVPARLEVTDETFDLGHDLRCVGGAGAEDDLHLGGKLGGGSEEVGKTLLPRDAADEHDGWAVRVDAVPLEKCVILSRMPRLDVDAVVDHTHLSRDRGRDSCAGCRGASRR